MRHIFLALVLCFICGICGFTQSAVTINENGAYFFDHGVVKKIPSDVDLSAPLFWRNYIVFLTGAHTSGLLVYNTDTGKASGFLEPGGHELRMWGEYAPIDKGRNLFFNVGGFEYELNPATLEIINRTIVADRTLDYDWWQYSQVTRSTLIRERTIRYYGEKYYIDVTIGNRINISNRGNWSIQGGKNDERFVLVVTDYTYPVR